MSAKIEQADTHTAFWEWAGTAIPNQEVCAPEFPHIRSAFLAGWSAQQARADRLEAALVTFKKVAREALIHWDADEDVKVGKLLRAMSGYLRGYREDIDEAQAALAKPEGQ